MFNYRGQFVSPNAPVSVTLYGYDAADVMDNNTYATVLESFVITLSLQVAKVNIEKV